MRAAAMPRDYAVQGVLVIVGTAVVMSFGDALVKLSSADFSVWQLYVLRALAAVPLLVGILRLRGALVMPARGALGWIALRSLFLLLMWLAFYAGLFSLSLAVVAAAYYTAPLFIVLLSALLVREPVGLRRWAAVLIGFAGVLVVLRPGSELFSPVTLLPVLAAFFYALAAVVTRARCSAEDPLLLSFGLNLGFLALGILASALLALWQPDGLAAANPFLFGPWTATGPREAAIILLLALVIVATSWGVAKAYQSPQPALIASFDYSYLVFAAFWSFAMFGDLPDGPTLLGMAMIAGAGILAIRAPAAAKSAREPA
jgi:drug/metabolite transporter (DMT)-like permease